MEWFRFYNDVAHDPKVQLLSPVLFKHWVNLLCLASENDGVLPSHVTEIAYVLRVTPEEVESLIREDLASLFDHTARGIEPHNWRKRQYKSDTSAERMRRKRERDKNRHGDGGCDVTETPSETETETETETEKASGRVVPVREQCETEPPPARPLETRSGFTPAAEIQRDPSPPPANGALKHTREAVSGYFPEPDDGILGKILQAVQTVDPEITDQECGIWVHAVIPDGGFKRARGPGWWCKTLPEELAKRPQDVRLLRAFIRGEVPSSEAVSIVHDANADWRLLKALRVWMAEQAEVVTSA